MSPDTYFSELANSFLLKESLNSELAMNAELSTTTLFLGMELKIDYTTIMATYLKL